MHVDGAFFDEDVIAPHLIEQLGAAENALGVRHEEMQQTEFGRPQIERAPGDVDPMCARVDTKPLGLNAVVSHFGCTAAQYRLDTRHQLTRRKRFGQIIVGAGFQTGHLILLLASGSQQNNG